jgi:outer membrane protein assembly factor BamB
MRAIFRNLNPAAIGRNIFSLTILSIPVLLIGNWCWGYLDSNQTTLISLDANSGKFLWSSAVDNELTRSIAVAQERVFVSTLTNPITTGDGDALARKYQYQIVAFAAKSGQKLWSFAPPDVSGEDLAGMVRSPLRANGDRLWVNTVSDRLPSKAPILVPGSNGKLVRKAPNISNLRQGQIVALDAQTGKLSQSIDRNWQVEQLNLDGMTTGNSTTALLRFNPALDATLEAYNSENGKQLWAIPVAAASTQSTSVVFNRYRLFSNSQTIFFFDKVTNKLSGYSWNRGRSKFQITLKTTLDPMKISTKYRIANDSEFQPVSNYLTANDETVYSINVDRTIAAFDPNTGTQQWEIPLPPRSRCTSPDSITPDRANIYLLCTQFNNNYSPSTTLFSIDSNGREVWFKQYPYQLGSQHNSQSLVTNSKSIYGILIDNSRRLSKGSDKLIALDRSSGTDRWQWQAKFRLYEKTITVDGDRLFIFASVPRWRLLFGAIE